MEEFGALAMIWLVHAAIAGLPTAPVVLFSRRRVRWQWWEFAAFILPFGVWAVLMISDLSTGRKSLSNLAEPICFSVAIPVAALIRVAIGNRARDSISAGALISALCGVAVATFFIVPPLPE